MCDRLGHVSVKPGINRNIVECKCDQLRKCFKRIREVLIETLWNVNSGTMLYSTASVRVLIEILWNVNLEELLIHAKGFSINRNIVECKCRYS